MPLLPRHAALRDHLRKAAPEGEVVHAKSIGRSGGKSASTRMAKPPRPMLINAPESAIATRRSWRSLRTSSDQDVGREGEDDSQADRRRGFRRWNAASITRKKDKSGQCQR